MAEGGLGTKIGSAFIQIGANIGAIGDDLFAELTNGLTSNAYIIGRSLESIGDTLFTKFSLPLAAATTANIAQFQALDREVRSVLTLFGTAPSLVDETFGAMKAGITEVSREVGGLEKDIAEGLYQTISAGIPRGSAFEFLEVAQMAAMADKTADLTSAVDGLTTVVNAFGLEASQTEQAADVMFKTVALGKTTFGELSSDIGRVAPLAANAGVAFEELFAIVGTLTLTGLKTSEAISFLRAAITGLLRPTPELTAIFNELGFASAEVAVPVLGLQGAFDAVVEKVGGSTSKLQELIGTSEGVSAVLGVTGDKADSFARVFEGVGKSVSSTERAFEIANAGVGRQFGRLTESFDRLGNLFGSFGAKFVVPVVQQITNVVNNMFDLFSGLGPVVDVFSGAWAALMRVFQLPVINQIVTGFSALAVTLSGLLGTVGLLAKVGGGLILTFLKIKQVTTIVTLLRSSFDSVRASVWLWGYAVQEGTVRAAALNKVQKALAVTQNGLAKAIGATKAATLLGSVAFAALGAAIGAVVWGITAAVKAQKEFKESTDTLGIGLDRLIDNLGLVNQSVGSLGIAEAEESMSDFEKANLGLVNRLRELSEVLDQTQFQDFLEGIAIDLTLRGNAPEQVEEIIQKLALLSDFGPIEFDIPETNEERMAGLVAQIEAAGVAFRGLTAGGLSFNFDEQAQDIASGLFTLFSVGQEVGDLDPFRDALIEVKKNLSPAQLDALSKAVQNEFESQLKQQTGEDIDLSNWFWEGRDVFLNPFVLLKRLEEAGIVSGISETLGNALEEGVQNAPIPTELGDFNLGTQLDELLLAFPEVTEAAEKWGLTLSQAANIAQESGDTALTSFGNLMDGLETAYGDSQQFIVDAFTEIEGSVTNQIPLLDIYGGKIKQSFNKWKEGQEQFRADLAKVTEIRAELEENLPDELVAAFDREPLNVQAWLAYLNENEFEQALQQLNDSWEASQLNASLRQDQSAPRIFTQAFQLFQGEFDSLLKIAEEQGPATASAFQKGFNDIAVQWVRDAESYMSQLEDVISRELNGPTIGAVTFSTPSGQGQQWTPVSIGGGNIYYITANVVPTDPTYAAERILEVIQTGTMVEAQ